MRRTPVIGKLPKVLIRNMHPQPTPLVEGQAVLPIVDLVNTPISAEDVEATAEIAAQVGQYDPGWSAAYADLIRTSCCFFATEVIRGPNEEPYRGKFLVGRHHLEWDEMIPNFDRMNILAARDHGKSFFWTLAYPIWKAGYNKPGSLGYIFSSTQPEAEKFLKMIKEELTENPKLTHLVPYTGTRFWSAKEITLKSGSVIRARGFGVKVRGGHPDWVIGDDVLDDEDIYSETIRRRNVDYFLSAIANMVPLQEHVPLHKRAQLVVVGTPMHHGDLYAALKETGEYECRVYPAREKDGTLLFPERYSEETLQRKRRELKSEARFAREFLCQPLSDEASLFPAHLFEGDVRIPYALGLPASYWENRGFLRYTGVDIAMSAETGGDYFVIFTVAVDDKGNRWIANITRGKGWGFQKQLDAIKDEYYLIKPDTILIEANQMQRVWADELVRETELPIRKFFTTGIGGRQPAQPWKKGATSISVNKHHLDRGVPALRLSLENRKWRIPRGDEHAIELTDHWIGEMGAIGWIDGKVQSVGEHDDLVMACLSPGQLVTTDRGLVPIEAIQVGDQVLTHKGRWRAVTETMSRYYEGRLYAVKPAGCSTAVRVTDEHPILSAETVVGPQCENWRLRPGDWMWRLPSELTAGRKQDGCYLLGPSVWDGSVPDIDLAHLVSGRKPPGFARWTVSDLAIWWRRDRASKRYFSVRSLMSGLFVGLYLAEGSCGDNGARVQFALHRRETYIVDFLRAFVGEQFGAPVKSEETADNGMVASFGSVIAHGLLLPLGKCREKAMPWEWLGAPNPFLEGVLRGWLIGDGSRVSQKLRGVSSSRNLIEQMRLIAIRLGLRVSVCPFSNENPAWQLDLDQVGVSKLLAQPTEMERDRWGTFAVPGRCSNGRTFPAAEGLAHRIASVDAIEYSGRVYNLEVAEDESYCVEGIAVHNCWMCNTAVSMGGATRVDMVEVGASGKPALLKTPSAEQLSGSQEVPSVEHHARKVLAEVSQGHQVSVDRVAYVRGVRDSLQQYVADCLEGGDQSRAVRVLQEIKRLDGLHGVRAGDVHLARSKTDGYGGPSTLEAS